MKKVFISYRRDGGEYLAGRIYDYLTDRGLQVFYDIESMRNGMFNVQLYESIAECDYFLPILSPNSLERCHLEDDWFRLEILKAMSLDKTIIPIIMPNFTFPGNMPEGIRDLVNYQGVVINNVFFKEQMNKLITSLGIYETSKPQKKKSSNLWWIAVFTAIILAGGALAYTALFNKKSDNLSSDTAISSAVSENKQNTEKPVEPSKPVIRGMCSATSIYKSFEGITYVPQNAFDRNNQTAWVENADEHGIGEKISILFNVPVNIKKIEIVNGYTKTEEAYYKNGRAKAVVVSLDTPDGTFDRKIQFDDIYMGRFPYVFENPCMGVTKMTITLSDGVYPGSIDQDTAITDVYLYDENGDLIEFEVYS